jgi:hypothetical protein
VVHEVDSNLAPPLQFLLERGLGGEASLNYLQIRFIIK